MKDEKARKLADEAIQRLIAELERGRSEALKNYLSAMSRFYKYSWDNTLLIHSQRSGATHVAGFHAWHDMGRSVKAGEKGIMIRVPMLVREKDFELRPGVKEDGWRVAGFRPAYVFDITQTEGKPLPQFAETNGDPRDHAEKLKGIVARDGITLTYDPAIAPAQGISTGGAIRLMPGLSPAEEFSVLTHELAHEYLHQREDSVRVSKSVRETQAEAVSYVVCRGIGLETNSAAADYITLYNGSKETLIESLSAIHETSSNILDELMPVVERPSQASEGRFASGGASLPASPTFEPGDMSDEISFDR